MDVKYKQKKETDVTNKESKQQALPHFSNKQLPNNFPVLLMQEEKSVENKIKIAFLGVRHPHMWHRVAVLEHMSDMTEVLGSLMKTHILLMGFIREPD